MELVDICRVHRKIFFHSKDSYTAWCFQSNNSPAAQAFSAFIQIIVEYTVVGATSTNFKTLRTMTNCFGNLKWINH